MIKNIEINGKNITKVSGGTEIPNGYVFGGYTGPNIPLKNFKNVKNVSYITTAIFLFLLIVNKNEKDFKSKY